MNCGREKSKIMTSKSVNHAHIFGDKLTSTYNAPSFSRSRWAGIFWASSFPSCRNGCESELLQMIDFSFHTVSYLSCVSYISIIQGLDDRKYTWPDLESKTGPFEPKPLGVWTVFLFQFLVQKVRFFHVKKPPLLRNKLTNSRNSVTGATSWGCEIQRVCNASKFRSISPVGLSKTDANWWTSWIWSNWFQ